MKPPLPIFYFILEASMTNGSENKKTNSEIEAKGINSSPLPSAHLGSVRIINLGYSKDVKEEMIITTSSHDRTFINKRTRVHNIEI